MITCISFPGQNSEQCCEIKYCGLCSYSTNSYFCLIVTTFSDLQPAHFLSATTPVKLAMMMMHMMGGGFLLIPQYQHAVESITTS
jgi:hypothetical protein